MHLGQCGVFTKGHVIVRFRINLNCCTDLKQEFQYNLLCLQHLDLLKSTGITLPVSWVTGDDSVPPYTSNYKPETAMESVTRLSWQATPSLVSKLRNATAGLPDRMCVRLCLSVLFRKRDTDLNECSKFDLLLTRLYPRCSAAYTSSSFTQLTTRNLLWCLFWQ